MQYMALSENRAPKNSCGPSSFPPQMVVLCSIKRPAGTEKVEFSKQLTTHYQKRIHQKKHNRQIVETAGKKRRRKNKNCIVPNV